MNLMLNQFEEEQELSPLDPPEGVTHLQPSEIKADPAKFQIRRDTVTERHVTLLMKTVKAGADLDSILVWNTTLGPVVIDGHHRLEAYLRAERKEPVPVEFFQGNLEGALKAAIDGNAKDKLPLTQPEKYDAAWRLAIFTNDTLKDIEKRTSVGKSTVGRMRKVRDRLQEIGDDPKDYQTWAEARKAAEEERSPEHDEEWKEAMARNWCDRLGKAFGNKPQNQHEVFAMALEMYLGRQYDEFVSYISGHADDDDGMEDEF